MEDTSGQTAESINPIENLSGWLEARDAEPKAAEPTEAAPDTTAQPASVLEAVLPEDFEHGFFKGKPVQALYNSYKESENAKQRAESERNELRRQMEALQREREIEATTRRVIAEQHQPPPVDPYAEIESQWFENPRAAASTLREQVLAEARSQASEEIARERDAVRQERENLRIVEAGKSAYETARQNLGIPPDVWQKRSKAILVELTDETSPYYGDGHNLFNVYAYEQVYRDLYGPPTTAAVPAAAPVSVPDPPGSSRAAAAVTNTSTRSPIADEQIRAWKQLAEHAGVDPSVFVAKMSRGR